MNGNALHDLRVAIDKVDASIIELIAERASLARAVGQVKTEQGQAIVDPRREAAVVARAVALARDAGLPEADIRGLYWLVVGISRRAQM
ncbi:MAG: chorismate mutase [Gemmatimonadaceae bacterium]